MYAIYTRVSHTLYAKSLCISQHMRICHVIHHINWTKLTKIIFGLSGILHITYTLYTICLDQEWKKKICILVPIFFKNLKQVKNPYFLWIWDELPLGFLLYVLMFHLDKRCSERFWLIYVTRCREWNLKEGNKKKKKKWKRVG